MLIFTGMLPLKSGTRFGFGATGSGRSDVRPHHHRLHASGGDQGFEFIENDMMNHEGKANTRFR
jgi:hypothetical protein